MTHEPVKKKKKPNQADMINLSKKEIDWYKKHPQSGNWRQFSKIRVNYTITIKKWNYKSNVLIEKFIAPFGMAKILMNLWSIKKWYHSFNVLLLTVKEEFSNLRSENYNPKVMPLDVPHEGMKDISKFWYTYCNICQKSEWYFIEQT